MAEAIFSIGILIFYIGFIVGIYALFIWICKKIVNSRGLPESYKWFGVLGVIGIIVVAVISPSYPPQYPPYNNPQYPPQNQYNPYQQNPNQPNTYFGNQPPIQNPNIQQPQSQVPPTTVKQPGSAFCPNCGAPVDNYAISCGNCGKLLR